MREFPGAISDACGFKDRLPCKSRIAEMSVAAAAPMNPHFHLDRWFGLGTFTFTMAGGCPSLTIASQGTLFGSGSSTSVMGMVRGAGSGVGVGAGGPNIMFGL